MRAEAQRAAALGGDPLDLVGDDLHAAAGDDAGQRRQVVVDRRRVGEQPVDRDQRAERREQRQQGVEGDAGRLRHHPVARRPRRPCAWRCPTSRGRGSRSGWRRRGRGRRRLAAGLGGGRASRAVPGGPGRAGAMAAAAAGQQQRPARRRRRGWRGRDRGCVQSASASPEREGQRRANAAAAPGCRARLRFAAPAFRGMCGGATPSGGGTIRMTLPRRLLLSAALAAPGLPRRPGASLAGAADLRGGALPRRRVDRYRRPHHGGAHGAEARGRKRAHHRREPGRAPAGRSGRNGCGTGRPMATRCCSPRPRRSAPTRRPARRPRPTTRSRISPRSPWSGGGPMVLVVPAASPFRTAQELLAAVKAAPGRYTWATSGAGRHRPPDRRIPEDPRRRAEGRARALSRRLGGDGGAGQGRGGLFAGGAGLGRQPCAGRAVARPGGQLPAAPPAVPGDPDARRDAG